MKNLIEVVHKKTGNIYYVVDYVTNCTNKNDGEEMVLYKNQIGYIFVRESEEFWEKFDKTGNLKQG